MIRYFFITLFFSTPLLADGYKLDPTFPQLPKEIKLAEVSGVAINSSGDIFIFHRGQRPIIAFDKSGKFLRTFGEGTKSAHGLRCDPADNVWASDVVAHTVTQFSPDGKTLLTLGEKDAPGEDEKHFNKPTDIAFAPNGDIFISDGYGNSRVVKFDKTGKYLLAWGKKGTGDGEFNTPHAVRFDSKGNLFVGDRENDRIQVFDQTGKFLRTFGGFAPFGLFITPDDTLFVADGRAHRVLKMTLEGKTLDTFGELGPEPGHFFLPHGIAVDKDGAVYVTEINGKRIQKFAPKP
ncbi:MAG TPA: peptidyl-alpha-hydroxyglycine alpha-amidating lyase family protein [Tepidisphaeraceae bacterium]|jgi:DNA-binding beta-propeller fold protein YncE|nr:peptidyl-alpha-hydroxyglycine alpha-amidating lyase family protein [Tepidisphaeraceae bacterium]